jgi:DNA-binding transcriptional LysR family regulator
MKKIKKAGMEFSRTINSSSLEVIADLTANGCGIGILPSRVADRTLKKIQRVPKAPVFFDEHCLIYRAENKNVRSIQTLNAAIRGCFAETDSKKAA